MKTDAIIKRTASKIEKKAMRELKKAHIQSIGLKAVRWKIRRDRIIHLFGDKFRAFIYNRSPYWLQKKLLYWWWTPLTSIVFHAPYIPLLMTEYCTPDDRQCHNNDLLIGHKGESYGQCLFVYDRYQSQWMSSGLAD